MLGGKYCSQLNYNYSTTIPSLGLILSVQSRSNVKWRRLSTHIRAPKHVLGHISIFFITFLLHMCSYVRAYTGGRAW
jgi:hypothetical protein